MTHIAFIGNMTSELELRYTQGGKAVGSVTVAVNRKKGDQEETDFHRVTVWEGMAENAARLPKGTRVLVVGRLTSRQYEDREGQKRTGWEVTADGFGPDLRYQAAQVDGRPQRDGGAANSYSSVPAEPDTWSQGGYGDDTPF